MELEALNRRHLNFKEAEAGGHPAQVVVAVRRGVGGLPPLPLESRDRVRRQSKIAQLPDGRATFRYF
jgi:hypothetical protein